MGFHANFITNCGHNYSKPKLSSPSGTLNVWILLNINFHKNVIIVKKGKCRTDKYKP